MPGRPGHQRSQDPGSSPKHRGTPGKVTRTSRRPDQQPQPVQRNAAGARDAMPVRSDSSPPLQRKETAATVAPPRPGGHRGEDWMLMALRPDLYQASIPGPRELGAEAVAPAPAQRGGGTSMPAAVQAKMEHAFGTDFSAVRIHEGPEARDLGALAYTQGPNIHFAPGQYQPTSQHGQELLGHELTHVIQQSQQRVGATMQAKGMAINDDPAMEREADLMGARAALGMPVSGATREPARAGASEPTSAVAQAKALAPMPALQVLSHADSQVVQMMAAFRIEGSSDHRKIQNNSGKMSLNTAEVQQSGISISFKSDEHAEYYKGQKSRKPGALYISMEAKDEFYGYLHEKFTSNANIEKDDNYKWMANLPRPSDCSDPVMRSLGMDSKDVLSFQAGWFQKDKNISNFEKQFAVNSVTPLDESAEIYVVVAPGTKDSYALQIKRDRLPDVLSELQLKDGQYEVYDDSAGLPEGLDVVTM
jgi:hypothetical protein